MQTRLRTINRLRKLVNDSEFTDFIAGLTGKLDSSGNLIANVMVGLNSPFIWVRLAGDRRATAITNLKISNEIADVPVITAKRRATGEREVVSLDPERATATLGGSAIAFASPPGSLQIINQPVNTVYAGPASGASLAPSFRALTFADIPISYVEVTADYDVLAEDKTIGADASGGAITVTLPSATGIAGREFRVTRLNSGGNNVTVTGTGGQTINGDTTEIMTAQWTSHIYVSTGSEWIIG